MITSIPQILAGVNQALGEFEQEQKDPHFLVIGATGVGKSSLINCVFRANLHAVNDVISTTRAFSTKEYYLDNGNKVLITDSPGYGEVGHDEEYSCQIVEASRQAHVVILVLKADEKGYQRDLNVLSSVFRNREFDQHRPCLLALNQIDKLPPVSEWDPPYDLLSPLAERDTEKVRNMKQKILLVQQQLASVTANSSSPVCPTMSEPREGPIFGIDSLREHLYDALPEVARLKYCRACQIAKDASQQLLAKLDCQADRIIEKAAGLALGAVLANFVPLSDWILLAPIQTVMIVKIAAVYGKTVNKANAMETIAALGAGLAARTVFQGIISLLPGIKNIVGPPYAAAATYGIGAAAKAYFKSGELASPEAIKAIVQQEYKRRQG